MNSPISVEEMPAAPPATSRVLDGARLTLARALWIAIALLTLFNYAYTAPIAFGRLQTVCAGADCPQLALTPADAAELERIGLSRPLFAAYALTLALGFALTSFVVGAVVFWRKGDDLFGLFVSLTLITFGMIALSAAPASGETGVPAWRMIFSPLAFFGHVASILLLYLLPDGRFVPRWTAVMALVVVLRGMARFFFSGTVISGWVEAIDFPLLLIFVVVGIAGQLYRYWRVAGPVGRQQTKWIVFGITLAGTGSLAAEFWFAAIGASSMVTLMVVGTVYYASLALIPISIGMAMLRSRLWEIDFLINRTLVYGALTAVVVGVYVLTVTALGGLFQSRSNLLVSLIATGLVAVLFQPLRERLQRGVNHLVYGERDDPYRVLSRLGQRLEATLEAEAILPTTVEMITQVLKLPYAALAVKQENGLTVAAACGTPGDWQGLLHVPLLSQATMVGELLVAPRAPGEKFSASDQRLLHNLAHQIGPVVHTLRLSADLQQVASDLQRSREQLVLTREEERRRLRRDLHDGLGPTLAALALSATTIGDLIEIDPAAAVSLAKELEVEIRAAVADVRRLVYELRPPTLDELGLVAAIRERAMQYSMPRRGGGEAGNQGGLQVFVEAPERLPPLPAAVEVAVYRITLEALTNVTHHAQARNCSVRLTPGDVLELEISDDGIGLPPTYQAGVGLLSMRERAAELGGTCIIESRRGVGTRVHVRLPVQKES
ncbi:MAG TPA: histidine kinase [Anaerolineae bacterium]